ncbi:TfoX/Sxy family protein [Companilactobacillus kimchii]|uniref:TfoX C-terminal domain-containing protein n=1 Tax=Companilactobacillus kimchii DSM 13961 = JCM 10707 TaxID=1423765 RepID=A0ABR5NRM0_9LACO|nr:TfoX/Sxy family protein [Companilactobacillus kimchii]KAE9559310.1 hypothetical protein ATN91_11750 [Companilactobacillus kimchii]KAE9560833.1 hypothetical protein ATN91_08495 [Companilactobacillus kimchii]KRK50698.1 hypothetical protein FC97_GL001337 [Companilactobacillus kimchii DSM 13961 = JCM 10707]GEO47545.1 competence protein TfoX [Companilactobacillus paralimentarius]
MKNIGDEFNIEKLTDLPNIGKVLNEQLSKINVTDVVTLKKLGSQKVYLKLKSLKAPDRFYCIQMLYSLEGAIQGVPYTKLSSEKKTELLNFFRTNK